MSFSVWRCRLLHHIITEQKLSDASVKIICSCGRHYAHNKKLGIIVSWDQDFERLYELGKKIIGESDDETKADRLDRNP